MSSAYLEILINRYLLSIRERLRGMLAMFVAIEFQWNYFIKQ